MRGLKSTIALLVVLVALGGYIYFVDNKRTDDAAAKDKVFTDVKADDIEEVRIKAEGGETTRLQKADSHWQVVDPVKVDADSSAVSAITSGLASLDIQRVVDENAGDLKQYGLEPARVEVSFLARGQKDERRVLMGEKSPTGGDVYAAMPGQKRVFLVSSFNDTTFNKNTFALRDKTILKFEREKADALELTHGADTFRFVRSGTEWNLEKPIAGRGDYGAIEGAIERLATAPMQGLVSDSGSDPKNYGLDKPTATASVITGSSRATLLLGTKDNALIFAKDTSRPMIFTVAPTIETDVFRGLSEFRRKDLFDARSFTTNRVEFRRAAGTMTFEKTKSKDGKDVWQSGGKDVDTMKMEDLLAKVTGLRAQSFESSVDASLANPELTVVFTFDTKKMETVVIGRKGSDVFGRRLDEPGSATLELMPVDDAIKSLDALK